VAEGVQASDLAPFLRARLYAVALPEAALACAARRAASDPDSLMVLDDEALARVPSPPLRRASSQLGRALLRTALVIWPEAGALNGYLARSEATPRPVAFGVVAATAGLTATGTARAWLYDDLATGAAAAPKLLTVGAAHAAAEVARLAGEIDELADRAARTATRSPAELPSASAPLLDQRSLRHQNDERRLFAS
jgi:urease accessory protein